MTDMVSVVIPIYNEASCLEKNVFEIEQYLNKQLINYELILVNDGSTDATEQVCRNIASRQHRVHLVSYDVNRGKGHAVKTGILIARGVYRVFMDADLAVPINFVGTCINRLKKGSSVVIGSRRLAESSIKVSEGVVRQFMGNVYFHLARVLLGLKVSDVTCGLKGFKDSAAIEIFERSKIERWGYDAEIIFLANILGYHIDEMPVDWYHSFDSKVVIGLDPLRSFKEMVLTLCYCHKGKYNLPKR
jgi:glycosyltransferase involved in cell wall biosynthesis